MVRAFNHVMRELFTVRVHGLHFAKERFQLCLVFHVNVGQQERLGARRERHALFFEKLTQQRHQLGARQFTHFARVLCALWGL